MSNDPRIQAKREAAARARRLALAMSQKDDVMRMLAFADELDGEAEAMEKELSPPPTQVTQVQQQQQQQHDTSNNPDDDSKKD